MITSLAFFVEAVAIAARPLRGPYSPGMAHGASDPGQPHPLRARAAIPVRRARLVTAVNAGLRSTMDDRTVPSLG